MFGKFFQNLYEIDGIEAFALLDNDNRIINLWSISMYDSAIFSEIGESYLQIFGLEESFGFGMDEIVARFDRGLLIARNRSKFMLIVIANASVNVSLVRLAINVGVAELEQSKKTQKILKKLPARKRSEFDHSKLDDVERSMIDNISESFGEE